MDNIITSVTNTSSTDAVVLKVPGYDPTAAVTVSASATLDLSTVMSVEALHAIQGQLSALVTGGALTTAVSIDSANMYTAGIKTWVNSHNSKIVFSAATYSATAPAVATVTVYMQDSSSVTNPFDGTSTVIIGATTGEGGGTPIVLAGGSALGAGTQQYVTLTNGQASITVSCPSGTPADINMELLSGPANITTSSTAIVTIS